MLPSPSAEALGYSQTSASRTKKKASHRQTSMPWR